MNMLQAARLHMIFLCYIHAHGIGRQGGAPHEIGIT